MSWFFLALVGPFLYAATNHIDKIILEKYFKEGGVGSLLIVSALSSVLALPFIFAFDTSVFAVSAMNVVALSIVGILNVMVLWFYLTALKAEEASVAVVFYQLVPVFGYVFGYFILGETLTALQLVAMGVIILGTAIISFEIEEDNHFRLRVNTVFFMTAAALCWALESVIFKAVALEESVVRSLFWEHLMLSVAGALIFCCIPLYRKHFLIAMRGNSAGVLGLNLLNETLYMVGNIVFAFAYLLAPIALVLLGESYQPLFVLGIGVLLTMLFPTIVEEKLYLRHLSQKIAAIALTGIGTYLLLVS
ncbi:MAG: DMT family transporter [Candidatus Paceibacterota bacterium]